MSRYEKLNVEKWEIKKANLAAKIAVWFHKRCWGKAAIWKKLVGICYGRNESKTVNAKLQDLCNVWIIDKNISYICWGYLEVLSKDTSNKKLKSVSKYDDIGNDILKHNDNDDDFSELGGKFDSRNSLD